MIDLQFEGEHSAHLGVFNAWLTPAWIGLGFNGLEAGFLF
jgi:hypothetical protein